MYTYPRTPIDLLPVELLAHIFVLGTHGDADAWDDADCPPFTADSVKTPLIYGSVCHHWRAVALRTPALYTSICITPLLLDASGEILDTTPICMYLDRSRACPLDVLIDARDPDWDAVAFADDGSYTPPFSAMHMQNALLTLVHDFHRLRSLSILTDVYAPMAAAISFLDYEMADRGAPQLRSLCLMRCDAHAGAPAKEEAFLANVADRLVASAAGHGEPATYRAPLPAPRLRTLRLVGVPAAWDALVALLQYPLKSGSPLRTLELSYLPPSAQPTLAQLATVLRSVGALQRVVLWGWDSPSLSPVSAFADLSLSHDLASHSFSAQGRHPTDSSTSKDDARYEDEAPPPLPSLQDLSLSLSGLFPALLALFSAAPRLADITVEDTTGAALPFDGVSEPNVLAHLLPTDSARPFQALERVTLRTATAPSAAEGSEEEEFSLGGVRVRVVRTAYADDALSDWDEGCAMAVDDDDDDDSSSEDDDEGGTASSDGADSDGDGGSRPRRACTYTHAWSAKRWAAAEEAAFLPGGAFNDAVFDARWAGVLAA
ncbi:hypothetical protein B0H15DRAFT_462639 [Mycena belliarum]|uniref:F-box domain-containing protein n=1 Tax=Mycena belliarum TaxID=1033014 RepID=A0AAD6XY11_9AGAR|nr:hypothetical protein B0H15DRAFT_462639 [Mycena belliae]